MMKLMIVDDELIVRSRLRETIDWAAIGCEVVAEAADGVKALQEYEKYKPDIVITDIMMHNSDGLDFITTIREKDSYTEIIILTGYEDFNFAKTALENEVGAYILKPIQNEVIIKYVEAAVEKLRKKQREAYVIDENTENEHWKKLMELFNVPGADSERISEVCRENNIMLGQEYYSVAIIDYDANTCDDDAYRILMETIKYAANVNRIRFFSKKTADKRVVLLALCNEENDHERFENMIEIIAQQYKKHTDNSVKTAISGVFRNVNMLIRAYNSVVNKLEADAEGKETVEENVKKSATLTEKALRYIRENYSTVSVESLAAELFVSKRTLMRKFKLETGKTVGEFIVETRIEAAVELVKTGEYKMLDVAHRVGYSDMKHFYETFKKVTGHSPKFYKS